MGPACKLDAHPVLLDTLQRAAASWDQTRAQELLAPWLGWQPHLSLRVKGTLRSLEAQQRAFRRGHSKLDGVARPSLHQYGPPAPAVDLWVYATPEPGPLVWDLVQAAMPQDAKRILGGTDLGAPEGHPDRRQARRTVGRVYTSWGYHAQEVPTAWPGAAWVDSLVWGGTWTQPEAPDRRRRTRFYDGPHLQLSARAMTAQVQHGLAQAGFEPGPVDGLPGKRTRRAHRAWCRSRAVPCRYIRGRRAFPFDPPTWDLLCASHPVDRGVV